MCPLVRNLPPTFNDFVAQRIRDVAKRVGAPLALACRPNIEVIFVDDPQELMDHVVKQHPELLGFHWASETTAVATVREPVQAWYVTATSNGMETQDDDPYGQAPSGVAGSRLTENLRSVFDHILILVDTGTLAGKPVGPVADYIAMLALAQPRTQAQCAALPSILDLLVTGCANGQTPASLTVEDEAYLKALYSTDPRQLGRLQTSIIVQRMAETLAKHRTNVR